MPKKTEIVSKVPIQGEAYRRIKHGMHTIGDVLQLCLAGTQDMLEGTISVPAANVINTAAGRVLKAVELQTRHSNVNEQRPLALPDESSDD